MEFEWDSKKAKSNLRKHRISFDEAATVFNDFLSFTYEDVAHSITERRYATLGVSNQARVIVVAHTMRGESVRIISARQATALERKWYEEEKENRSR